MFLAIDVGNTRLKWALYPQARPGAEPLAHGAEFLENTDKLAEFRNEARRLGIRVEPPSLRSSGVDFDVHEAEDGTLSIRYALSAVKGVGEGQAAAIVEARGKKPFRDLADFAARINPRDVNKRVLESLAASVPFPKRLGKPEEFGSLALELVRNSYFNAQCIRLDGAIRMAPR